MQSKLLVKSRGVFAQYGDILQRRISILNTNTTDIAPNWARARKLMASDNATGWNEH